jgi:ATP-dependent Clp protease protease subunit
MAEKPEKTDIERENTRLEYSFEKGINFKDRIIQITGSIKERESFDYLDAALCEMERDSKKTVTLRINSPGGSVYEALAMVGRIENSKCHVTTECYGHAMSAAGLLLASGSKRRMSSRAWFMHHEISSGLSGSLTEMQEELAQLQREQNAWASAMADFSEQSEDFWMKAARKSDFYLSAEECLSLGVVDELF